MSDAHKESMFIIAYKGQDTADEVYKTLRSLQKDGKVNIKTAATVNRRPSGKLRLTHKRRVTFWKGTVGGGGLGLLVAGLGSGAVLGGAVVGAILGGIGGKHRREAKAFLDDKLGQDDSALVIVIKDADWAAVEAATEHYGGKDLAVELTPDAQAQINALANDEAVAAAVAEEVEAVDDPEVEDVEE